MKMTLVKGSDLADTMLVPPDDDIDVVDASNHVNTYMYIMPNCCLHVGCLLFALSSKLL